MDDYSIFEYQLKPEFDFELIKATRSRMFTGCLYQLKIQLYALLFHNSDVHYRNTLSACPTHPFPFREE